MQLALYKGKGLIGNAITRWWTGSQYSHCELVIDGVCHSASFMDGGVRKKVIDLESGRWDVVPVSCADKEHALKFFDRTEGKAYDWIGILGAQIFNRTRHHPDKYFCSEWCADAIGLPHPETFKPHTLGALVRFLNKGGSYGGQTGA